MSESLVECELCRSGAKVIATEGEIFRTDRSGKPRIILTIECPHCGRRKQLEKPKGGHGPAPFAIGAN